MLADFFDFVGDFGLAEFKGLVFLDFGKVTPLLVPSFLILVHFYLLRKGEVHGSSPLFGSVFTFKSQFKEPLLRQNSQRVLTTFLFNPTHAVATLHRYDVDDIFEIRVPGKHRKTNL